MGTAVMGVLSRFHMDVATIGSRFSYLLADGSHGQGIPAILPQFYCRGTFPRRTATP